MDKRATKRGAYRPAQPPKREVSNGRFAFEFLLLTALAAAGSVATAALAAK